MSHILVVEPDPEYREQLCDLLERNGHTVDSAARYPQSVAKEFAAIVANARSASATPDRNIPVILVAEKASVRAAVDAIRGGAADYLPRDFDPGELLASLECVTSQGAEEASHPPEIRYVATARFLPPPCGNCFSG